MDRPLNHREKQIEALLSKEQEQEAAALTADVRAGRLGGYYALAQLIMARDSAELALRDLAVWTTENENPLSRDLQAWLAKSRPMTAEEAKLAAAAFWDMFSEANEQSHRSLPGTQKL